MHPTHAEQIEILEELIPTAQNGAEDVLRIGVLSGPGHGDHARGIAFCKAARERYKVYCDAHVTLFTRHCGSMVEHDMALARRELSERERYGP